MERKSTRVEVKEADADTGEVVAVFATLNVRDKHGDVTLPGAFTSGEEVLISAYQHESWNGALPVGRGAIKEVGNEAIFEGKYFLDTAAGRENFTVVKQTQGLMEWSYGFDVLKHSFGSFEDVDSRFLEKMGVHEVSPVLIGAGEKTRTLSVKSGTSTFSEETEAVLAALKSLRVRAADVLAMRQAKGKTLSTDSVDQLKAVEAELAALTALLAVEPPQTEELKAVLHREFLRYNAGL